MRPVVKLPAAAALGVLVLGWAAPASAASGTPAARAPAKPAIAGLAWSSPKRIDPPLAAGVASISCPTAQFCAALQDASVTTYNGTSWSRSVQVVPPPNGLGMMSISCPGAHFCAAVGNEGGPPFTSYAVTFNGTSWTQANLPTPPV